MICKEIIEIIEKQSPKSYACDWDNVGLLIGSHEKDVKRIYIALDADDKAIQEAVAAGADMLLTHHPMIFKGMKKINSDDFIGRRVIELIKNDMAYYAMHTNFDISQMADLAAERMGLLEQKPLQVTGTAVLDVDVEKQENAEHTAHAGGAYEIGIGKIGKLPEKETVSAFAERVKKAFEVDSVKVFVNPMDDSFMEKEIQKIAICPGSGKSVIKDALKAGAQVFVTGDIDHHEGIDAAACGMIILDAGHYGVEKLFVPYMEQYLKGVLPEIEIIAAKPRQPFIYV